MDENNMRELFDLYERDIVSIQKENETLKEEGYKLYN